MYQCKYCYTKVMESDIVIDNLCPACETGEIIECLN